MYKASNFWENR